MPLLRHGTARLPGSEAGGKCESSQPPNDEAVGIDPVRAEDGVHGSSRYPAKTSVAITSFVFLLQWHRVPAKVFCLPACSRAFLPS